MNKVLLQIEEIGNAKDDESTTKLQQLSSQLRNLMSKGKQLAIDKEAIKKALAQAKIDAENDTEYNYIKRKNQRLLKQQESAKPNHKDASRSNTELANNQHSHRMRQGIQNARDKAVPKSNQRINITDSTVGA